MATHSRDIDCPNCGNTATETTETNPFERAYISCCECGFYMNPVTGFLTLEELNGMRKELMDSCDEGDMELDELTELPMQDASLQFG